MATVGLIANPHAGKDIRRLVAHAGTVSDAEKMSIIQRVARGAVEGGATALLTLDDAQRLARRALDRLDLAIPVDYVDARDGSGSDTIEAASEFRKAELGAVVVLGGDGTTRDVAKGWLEAPVVAISTGTNNVFPAMVEATTAGVAAGLVAVGVVELEAVSRRAKALHVRIDGQPDDVALVDVALVSGQFVGSRAVWDPALLQRLAVTTAEPGTVGLSAVAAAAAPLGRDEPGGLELVFGADAVSVRAPLAPGKFADVSVAEVVRMAPGEPIAWTGPGVLTFDGERDRILADGQVVELVVRHDGPWVIDVAAACGAVDPGFEKY